MRYHGHNYRLACWGCGGLFEADDITVELLRLLKPLGVRLECVCGAPLVDADDIKPVQPVEVMFLQKRYGERWQIKPIRRTW